MSFPATIAKPILETVLAHLALLFLTAATGDAQAARDAAIQMLAAYDPQNADELALAAQIVTLQFHALEALGSAAEPGLSASRVIRLRGSAVSLSRESHKARRRLDQVQRARRTATQQPPAEAPQPDPAAKAALDVVATAQETIRDAQKTGGKNWRHTLQKRLLTAQMTETAKAQQARYAAQQAAQGKPAPDTMQSAA